MSTQVELNTQTHNQSIKYFQYKLSHINMETGNSIIRGHSKQRVSSGSQTRKFVAPRTARLNASIDLNR